MTKDTIQAILNMDVDPNVKKQIEEALSDEGFKNKIAELKNPEDAIEAFKEKGIDLSKEDIGKYVMGVFTSLLDSEKKEQIEEAFSDEEFVQKLSQLESPEDAQAAFKDKGMDFSIGEIMEIRDMIIETLDEIEKNNVELSVEELDEVAGGSPPAAIILCAGGLAYKSVATGAIVGLSATGVGVVVVAAVVVTALITVGVIAAVKKWGW